MCDSGPFGIDEIEKQGGVDTGMTLGSCHMILLISSHARKMQLCMGYFGLFLVYNGGHRVLYCVTQGSLGHLR